MVAAMMGETAVVESLMALGADHTAVDNAGCTALDVSDGNTAAVLSGTIARQVADKTRVQEISKRKLRDILNAPK